MHEPTHKPAHRWAWGFIALFVAALIADAWSNPQASPDLTINLVRGGVDLLLVGLALAALGRAFDRRGDVTPARELALAVLSVALVLMLSTSALPSPGASPSKPEALELVVTSFTSAVVIVGVWLFAFRYPRARQRAAQALALSHEAELAELRSRLQPHFLGNALNSLAGLVTRDPERARDLLADFADLLRDLSVTKEAERRLETEIEWIRRYASILEARHAGDIVFRWNLDEAAMSAKVPTFLLQPLVENAVVHGQRRLPGHTSIIEVSATRRDDAVIIDIRNEVGDESAERPSGLGLDLVRRRLALARPPGALEVSTTGNRHLCRVRLAAQPSRATPLEG